MEILLLSKNIIGLIVIIKSIQIINVGDASKDKDLNKYQHHNIAIHQSAILLTNLFTFRDTRSSTPLTECNDGEITIVNKNSKIEVINKKFY
jgi:hypothetical protein